MLADRTKTYEAVLLLGRSTDTQDTTGLTLTRDETGALALDPQKVREVILGFKGDYDQIPPMYSALKVDGKKLCDLARAGKEVERKARRVEILDISILKLELRGYPSALPVLRAPTYGHSAMISGGSLG